MTTTADLTITDPTAPAVWTYEADCQARQVAVYAPDPTPWVPVIYGSSSKGARTRHIISDVAFATATEARDQASRLIGWGYKV